eukprot:376614_1
MLLHIWSMLVVLVLLTNTVQNDNQFNSTSPILPHSDMCMASFYYNNWIYIFGGFYNKRSLVQYNIHNGSIIDHGTNALPLDVIGFSQYWTQISNLFYWIDQSGDNIIIYNVASNTFEQNINILQNVGNNACLATNGEVLAVIGGPKLPYTLQIYNLSSGLWLNNTPSMQESRAGGFTCMIVDNWIYAIGGFVGNNDETYDWEGRKTIEKVPLNDIKNQNWQFIQDLTIATSNLRSVTRGHFIYAIAGYYYNSTYYAGSAAGYVEQIQIINCLTGTVTNGSYLTYTASSVSPVIVNDVIYVFGGKNTHTNQPDVYRRIQYFSLLTEEPTYNPTNEPTNIPSLEPTIYPTNVPTLEPTTYMPSLYPSETKLVSTSFQSTSEIGDQIDDPNDNIWIYILIIIVCVVLLLSVIGCIVLYKYKLKKSKDNAKNNHQQVLELNTPTVGALETTEMINT